MGFEKAGFEIIWANEFAKTIHETYRYNHPQTELNTRDIREINESDIPDSDGIIGGPPCQSWSLGGKCLGINDERGKLVFDYIREDSLEAILRIQTSRIVDSMRKNKHIRLEITPEAFQQLYDYCLKDLPKGEGGRGIGNSVEKYLINPRSRYVFDYGIGEGQEIKITNLVTNPDGGYSLEAE